MTDTAQTLLPVKSTGVSGITGAKAGIGGVQDTLSDDGKAFAAELDQAQATARRSADTSATAMARQARRGPADEADGVEPGGAAASTLDETAEAGAVTSVAEETAETGAIAPVPDESVESGNRTLPLGERQMSVDQETAESKTLVADVQASTSRDRDPTALDSTPVSMASPAEGTEQMRGAQLRSNMSVQHDAQGARPGGSDGDTATTPVAASREAPVDRAGSERAGVAERGTVSTGLGTVDVRVHERPLDTGSATGPASVQANNAGVPVSRASDEKVVSHTVVERAVPDAVVARDRQAQESEQNKASAAVRLTTVQGGVEAARTDKIPSSTAAVAASASVSPQRTATATSEEGASADAVRAGVPLAASGEMLSQSQLLIRHRHASSGAASAGINSAMPKLRESSGEPRMVRSEDGSSLMAAEATELPDQLSTEMARTSLSRNELFQDLQRQRAALTETVAVSTGSLASDTDGTTTPTNMFLSMPGGIVAAQPISRIDGMAAPLAAAPVTVPLMAEDSDIALAGNVRWMAREGVQNATVNVAPAGMGPISVRVGIEQDQMSVSIVASQQATREALDALLPRLREQLMAQGHESVRLDVSDGRGDASRNGHGQMFAGSHDSAAGWSQGERNSSGEDGDQRDFGRSGTGNDEPDSLLAEDLQRLANRRLGSEGQPSAFDAYV